MNCNLLWGLRGVVFCATVFAASSVRAQVIISDITTDAYTMPNTFLGQSFALSSGFNYQISGFVWDEETSTPLPAGSGKIYVFDQPFTGTPAQLASASTGLVGVSNTWSSGQFTFATPLSVAGGATYYAYASASLTDSWQVGVDATGPFPGIAYTSSDSSDAFASYGAGSLAYNFQVYGTATAVPEPSTYAAIFGLVSLGFVAYRRRLPA